MNRMPPPRATRRATDLRFAGPPPVPSPAEPPTVVGARPRPWILVIVDGTAGSTRRLVWTLQEAARRDATAVVVAALDELAAESRRPAARVRLQEELRRAHAASGVHARCRTAWVDPLVLAALTDAVLGSELVVDGPRGRAALRPALPRPPGRRPMIRSA